MKALLTLIALFFVQQVSANDTTVLQKGDLNLSAATGEITSVREICPKIPGRVSCMAYGSVVTVKVTLQGCLDRMGGYFTKFEHIDGKGVLYFGAINIFNKASMTARCVRAPSETVSIGVPFEGEIELVNMDYTGTTTVAQ